MNGEVLRRILRDRPHRPTEQVFQAPSASFTCAPHRNVIVGSCRKKEAAPTGSGSSLGGNVQCGQLVLLHGNGSMIQDFESSGLLAMAAKKYRVIAFDRPGFGHSERPRATI